jgi:hypothetical protein
VFNRLLKKARQLSSLPAERQRVGRWRARALNRQGAKVAKAVFWAAPARLAGAAADPGLSLNVWSEYA